MCFYGTVEGSEWMTKVINECNRKQEQEQEQESNKLGTITYYSSFFPCTYILVRISQKKMSLLYAHLYVLSLRQCLYQQPLIFLFSC